MTSPIQVGDLIVITNPTYSTIGYVYNYNTYDGKFFEIVLDRAGIVELKHHLAHIDEIVVVKDELGKVLFL